MNGEQDYQRERERAERERERMQREQAERERGAPATEGEKWQRERERQERERAEREGRSPEEIERRQARERGEEGLMDRERREREEKLEPPPPARRNVSFRTTHPDGWEEGFPKVYFSVWERHAPFVVRNKAEEAGIDKRFWVGLELPRPEFNDEEKKNLFEKEKYKEVLWPQPMPLPIEMG